MTDAFDVARATCAPIAQRFGDAGFRLYLVGGIVRDLLNGTTQLEPDYDFTTDARPEFIKKLVAPIASAVWTQGEKFGTIAAWVDGRRFEITTHRAEVYESDSRKPNVVFSDRVEVDLSRRDFSVNAIAIELTAERPTIIDPFGGAADLEAKRLRTPLGPDVAFSDDPLRMMRAARFMSRLALQPDQDLEVAATAMADRIQVVSAERVRDELFALLKLPDPTAGLRFLVRTTLADRILPEMAAEIIDSVGTVADDQRGAEKRLALVFLTAASSDMPSAESESSPRHSQEGVASRDLDVTDLDALMSSCPTELRLARGRLRFLRCSNETTQTIERLIRTVTALRVAAGWSPHWAESAPVLRTLASVGGDLIDDSFDIAQALGGNDDRFIERIRDLEHDLRTLGDVEDLSSFEPGLDGETVMQHLGIGAGPTVGHALRYLTQIRFMRGVVSQSELLTLLDSWSEAHA